MFRMIGEAPEICRTRREGMQIHPRLLQVGIVGM